MHLTYDRTRNLFEDLIYLIELESVENVMGWMLSEREARRRGKVSDSSDSSQKIIYLRASR